MCLSVFGGGEHTRMRRSKRDETVHCGRKISLLTGENGRKEGLGEDRLKLPNSNSEKGSFLKNYYCSFMTLRDYVFPIKY